MLRYDTDMYGKIFGSMFTGSMRGKGVAQLVFVNMLATCTENGICDKTPLAIAEEIGFPLEEVNQSIQYLSSPDPMSRSPLEEGRRIILLDDHRQWGWSIVNHEYYRALNKQIERRYQWRESKRRSADRFTKPAVEEVQTEMLTRDIPPPVASIESRKFIDFYESKGWKVGKNPMVQWKSAVANWVRRIEDNHCASVKPTNGEPNGADKVILGEELKRINERMKKVLESYDSHQTMCPEDRQKMSKMKARKSEIMQKLGVQY